MAGRFSPNLTSPLSKSDGNMRSVFLSHSSVDKPFVRNLACGDGEPGCVWHIAGI